MTSLSRAGLLKRGLLLFWCLWITIVVMMNVGDALVAMGLFPDDWKLASGNYHAMVTVTSVYGTPHWLDGLLFAGVILWESVCMVFFWRAFGRYRSGTAGHWRTIYLAFTGLLALFAGFILADEVAHKYGIEGDHRGIAILLLASLLALQLLPDRLPGR